MISGFSSFNKAKGYWFEIQDTDYKVHQKTLKTLALLALVTIAFLAGRFSSTNEIDVTSQENTAKLELFLVQDNDPRELQPFPGPGDNFGLPQGSEECPLYFFQDGQLFQMQPGEGLPGQNGSPELFPLQPVPPNQRQPAPAPIPEQFS